MAIIKSGKKFEPLPKHVNDRMKYLYEYTIKGANDGTLPDDQEIDNGYFTNTEVNLTEEDPTPSTDDSANFQAPEVGGNNDEVLPTDSAEVPEEKEEESPEETSGDAPETTEEILTDLVKIHSDKIERTFSYLEELTAKVAEFESKIAQINDVVSVKLPELEVKVKDLTPPTPAENLDKMVNISNGVKIDDYWNSWLAANNKDGVVQNNQYQATNDPTNPYRHDMNPQVQQNAQAQDGKVEVTDLRSYNKDEIKKSFYSAL